MNKVTLEITAEGWKTSIHIDGKTYNDDAVLNNKYSATHYNDIDELPLPLELLYALNSVFAFDVSSALLKHEEELGGEQ